MMIDTDTDMAMKLRLIAVARNQIESPKHGETVAHVTGIEPAWKAAQVTAWLLRVQAGRFDNEPDDTTDDPRSADHILRQARLAVDHGDLSSDVSRESARQVLHLAGLALDVPAAEAAALRWHREHDETDFYSWLVTDAGLSLMVELADWKMWVPNNALARGKDLDVLAATLLEQSLANTQGDQTP